MPERWVRQVAGLADERSWRALVRDWRPEGDVRAVRGALYEGPRPGLRAVQ